MLINKKSIFILFFFISIYSPAQVDSSVSDGTIKVSKVKAGKIYVRSFAKYTYDLSDKEWRSVYNTIFQPFPVVDGYPFPFNYSQYFNNKFKSEKINLKENPTDTVRIEVKISAKGKVSLNNQKSNKNYMTDLQCLRYLKEIKEWQPAYFIKIERGMYKKRNVIKPIKKNIAVSGIITIIFSTEPFED
jgi:hypothetical protein